MRTTIDHVPAKAAAFNKPSRVSLAHLPPDVLRSRVLDTAEAAELCKFSVPHWRRLYRAGRVPKPLKLSARKLGWRAGDLLDWLESRAAA